MRVCWRRGFSLWNISIILCTVLCLFVVSNFYDGQKPREESVGKEALYKRLTRLNNRLDDLQHMNNAKTKKYLQLRYEIHHYLSSQSPRLNGSRIRVVNNGSASAGSKRLPSQKSTIIPSNVTRNFNDTVFHLIQNGLIDTSSTDSFELIVPAMVDYLPHLLAVNPISALTPALRISKNRRGIHTAIAIPTIKRPNTSYLLNTLKSILDNLLPSERKDILIVVFIGDLGGVTEFVAEQVQLLHSEFPGPINEGILEILVPPTSYYPNLDKVPPTFNDSVDRMKWRTKQNLDYAYLMMYCKNRAQFYLQLEDDVIASPSFYEKMLGFIQEQSSSNPKWYLLEFSTLGFIGKLFRTSDLASLVEFLFMFHKEKPVDWLLDNFLYVRYCSPDKSDKECGAVKKKYRIRHKPSLFQHVGMHSSLKGKVQRLKERDFMKGMTGPRPSHKSHPDNPPARASTSLKVYQKYTLEDAYKGESVFWGLLPQSGDWLLFEFNSHVNLKGVTFRSGNKDHPKDIFYNTSLEIVLGNASSECMINPAEYQKTQDGYFLISWFPSSGVMELDFNSSISQCSTKAVRLFVHTESENWVIMPEIWIRVLGSDRGNSSRTQGYGTMGDQSRNDTSGSIRDEIWDFIDRSVWTCSMWMRKLSLPRVSTEPRRLLRLLRSPNSRARMMALRSLATLKNLPDWVCIEVIQSCYNAEMMSSLALRDSNVPEYLRKYAPLASDDNDLTIETELRCLLSSLHPFSRDLCIGLNTELALRNTTRPVVTAEEQLLWTDEDDVGDLPTSFTYSSRLRKLLLYTEALGLESTLPHQRERMVNARTFNLLYKLWNYGQLLDPTDFRLPILILKVLSNMALSPMGGDHFLISGWIATLAQCRKMDKIEIKLLSEKCLANLRSCSGTDIDCEKTCFDDGIYILHDSPDRPSKADIVFVHGLRGGVFYTWRQKDIAKLPDPRVVKSNRKTAVNVGSYSFCWPKDWLPHDLGVDVRILGFDYSSFVTDWRMKCPEFHERNTIIARSKDLLEKLMKAGVGERPIIWVCHSMGGLMVKELLCANHSDEQLASVQSKFLYKTIGVAFYSVPHCGSPFASRGVESNYRYFLQPSIEVTELRESSKYLQLLQSSFLELAKDRIQLVSLSETIPTKFPMRITSTVVPSKSANVGIGPHYRLNENHRDMCKPVDRNSVNYRILLDFVQRLIS